jgi:5-formyltetrahydrofolate cyclo-ligase
LDKRELRQAKLAQRDGLPEEVRKEKSRLIARQLFELPAFAAAKKVMLFASMGSEVHTKEMALQALKEGKRVALPVTDRVTRELIPGWITSWDELVPGVWGIPEPDRSRLWLAPIDEIDLVVVPGVVFDQRGYRIGYGGGYYDRLLPRLRPGALKVGIAFAEQIVDTVPAREYDIPVDLVITDEGTLTFLRLG